MQEGRSYLPLHFTIKPCSAKIELRGIKKQVPDNVNPAQSAQASKGREILAL